MKRMQIVVCGVIALATSGADAADSFGWSTKAAVSTRPL